MKRTIYLLFVLAFVSISNAALGNDVKRVPTGMIANHLVARITFFFDGVTPPELVGYIPFIEGVRGPFFDGPPGVETAYFTIRFNAGPPPIALDPGSNVAVNVLPPGATFDIYYDKTPDQSWDNPDSFSNGRLVATFEESALLTTTIAEPDGSGSGFNYFSSKPIYAKSFKFHRRWVNFKDLVPNGTTTYNFVSNTPVSFLADRITFAFAGSAIAVGEASRRDHFDD